MSANKLAHDITRRDTWLIAQNKVRKRTSTLPSPSFLRGAQQDFGARAESRKRSSYLRAAHPAERFVS